MNLQIHLSLCLQGFLLIYLFIFVLGPHPVVVRTYTCLCAQVSLLQGLGGCVIPGIEPVSAACIRDLMLILSQALYSDLKDFISIVFGTPGSVLFVANAAGEKSKKGSNSREWSWFWKGWALYCGCLQSNFQGQKRGWNSWCIASESHWPQCSCHHWEMIVPIICSAHICFPVPFSTSYSLSPLQSNTVPKKLLWWCNLPFWHGSQYGDWEPDVNLFHSN